MADSRDTRPDVKEITLNGTTLRVYRYLYREGRPMGIHDIQRGLGLSSSSVAQYHAKKLLSAGLIKWDEPTGHYSVDRVIFDNMIRIRRSLIPLQIGYAIFFGIGLAFLIVLFRPDVIGGQYVFAVFLVAIAFGVFVYQAIKASKGKSL